MPEDRHENPAAIDASIVIPAKDEAQTIAPLVAEIVEVMDTSTTLTYEILFIDDGSSDGTWEAMNAVVDADPRVRAIRFRRNFGKAAALSAGLAEAAGRIVITMDADMQDDPNELPRMLAAMDTGFDLVTGFKEKRQDPLGKRLPSKLFNRATGLVTGLKLNDHNSGLRVGTREVYDTVPLYGELHRYVPALAHAHGFKVTEVPVHHRPRTYGKSKYGLERYARGALDLLTVVSITRYGRRPSHLLGGLGLLFGAIGNLILLYLLGVKLFTSDAIGGRPLLQLGILLDILAVQLVGMGLLAELIIHRTDQNLNTDAPIVARRVRPVTAAPTASPNGYAGSPPESTVGRREATPVSVPIGAENGSAAAL
ncbi:MAG: glycosyltransferase family 2 protein [bacterium]